MLSSGTDNLKETAASATEAAVTSAPSSEEQDSSPRENATRIEQSTLRSLGLGKNQRGLLLVVLRDPQQMAFLSLKQWDILLRYARQAGLLSRLAVELRDRNLMDEISTEVHPHIVSALAVCDRHERIIRWEFNRLQLALNEIEGPLVLLKGAAYLAAGLSISKGRIYSDIDLLVPAEQLSTAEELLNKAGWRPGALDPQDARYFRAWLHEIPPLKHRRRRTVLDVHHTILPRTDKLQVDPQELLAEASSTEHGRMRVLCPADMVLHSAAHLFRNGDFSHAARDLLDLDGMIRHFAQDPTFWTTLISRAELHNLQLPCFCGLRFAAKYFHTPLSDEVWQEMDRWQPGRWSLAIIDRLVDQALMPKNVDGPDSGRDRAISLLAHWPVPRWQAMFTGLFWTKRLPKWGQSRHSNVGPDLTNPERRVPDRPE